MLNSEYQRGLEAAAQLIERELKEYRMSADACDAVGNHVGGTNDTVGVLTCQRLAAAIRGLTSTDCGSSNLPPTAAVGAPKGNSVEDLQSSGGKLGFIAHCLACRAKARTGTAPNNLITHLRQSKHR